MLFKQNTNSSAPIPHLYVNAFFCYLLEFCINFLASKIELFSSNEDTNTVDDVASITWDYLGYITLSDNQSTGFKSRELKSANVPVTTASFFKLKLSKNHSNSHNNNNQVLITTQLKLITRKLFLGESYSCECPRHRNYCKKTLKS